MRLTYHSLLIVCLAVTSIPVFAEEKSNLSADYSKCMEKSGGVDPATLDCIAAETVRQDKRLNAAYKKLLGQLEPERKKQLQEAQRLWIKYTEANCNFYHDPNGGTAARLSASGYSMSARAARAEELERFIER